MTEPTHIVINSFTAANDNLSNNLISVTSDQLLHCSREHGVLNLYPGCVMLKDMDIDSQNMVITYHLGFTQWWHEHGSNCHNGDRGKVNIKEWRWRTVKDCTLGPYSVILKIKVPRVECVACGKTKWLKPSFVHAHHRITLRLYGQILQLLDIGQSHIDLKKIGQITGVEADIIRDIDKAKLKETFKDIKLDNVRNIAIDEISIKKHHKYISVIIDADTRRLLYAAYGRKKEDLKPFFDKLQSLDLLDKIEGAVMDGNCGYQNLVKELCPNAKIVLDLFHCLQQYNKEVADATRISKIKALQRELNEMNAGEYLKNKPKYKKMISDLKQSKWLSYMGFERLNTREETYSELIDSIKRNETMLQIAIFSDHIRELWHTGRTPEQVKFAIHNLNAKAQATNIPYLIRFCNKLKSWTEYIVHAATTGLNTSILEGCNGKFKTIKKVAYGFRDIGYFILKLHQALAKDRETTLKKFAIAK